MLLGFFLFHVLKTSANGHFGDTVIKSKRFRPTG